MIIFFEQICFRWNHRIYILVFFFNVFGLNFIFLWAIDFASKIIVLVTRSEDLHVPSVLDIDSGSAETFNRRRFYKPFCSAVCKEYKGIETCVKYEQLNMYHINKMYRHRGKRMVPNTEIVHVYARMKMSLI